MWQAIVEKFHKTFVTNWLTGIPAGLALVCESAALLDMLPEPWNKNAHALCLFMLTIGVIGAKGQNVSNSPIPAKSQIVSDGNEARENPAEK